KLLTFGLDNYPIVIHNPPVPYILNSGLDNGKRSLVRNGRSLPEPPAIIKPPKKPNHEFRRHGLLGEVVPNAFTIELCCLDCSKLQFYRT
ncbi:7210_t:CDS:1, partial [Acaulospora colombiana]